MRLDLLLLAALISSFGQAAPAWAGEGPPQISRYVYGADWSEYGETEGIWIDIYDAASDPAILDFTLHLRVSETVTANFGMGDILSFKLIRDKGQSVRGITILFDVASIQKQKKNRYSKFYSPKTLDIDFKARRFKFDVIAEESASKTKVEETERGSLDNDKIPASEWFPLESTVDQLVVLEPNNTRAVAFETYFAGRSVRFSALSAAMDIDKAEDEPTFSWGSSSYNSGPSVEKASDIQLSKEEQKYRKKIWKLIQGEHKPTMQEFLSAIEYGPAQTARENPFQDYGGSGDSYMQAVVSSVPEMIVALEKAFPGGIWYALGRDIYLLGDAIDAFYISKGNVNRVRRLHASAPSFEDASPELTAKFLESNGFNLRDVKKEPPRIIFDVTSYNKSEYRYSQSSHLMRAAYDAWKKNGRDPRDLLRKVNFVSVSDGVDLTPGLNLEKYFSEMTFHDGPETILRVDPSSSLSYTRGWHGVYGPFVTEKSGNVTSPPGSASSYRARLEMLGEMFAVAQGAFSEEFKQNVSKKEKLFNARVRYGSCGDLLR